MQCSEANRPGQLQMCPGGSPRRTATVADVSGRVSDQVSDNDPENRRTPEGRHRTADQHPGGPHRRSDVVGKCLGVKGSQVQILSSRQVGEGPLNS